MADFFLSLDPGKLVWAETFLTFSIAPFESPAYNLPIFLFGLLANELQEGLTALQAFTMLTALSIIWDIVFLATHGQNWFLKLVTSLILILKVPTAISYGLSLRNRGAQFGGLGNLNNIRADLNGPTVWQMPGAFSDRGYQNVDDMEPSLATPTNNSGRPPASHTERAQPPLIGTGTYQGV